MVISPPARRERPRPRGGPARARTLDSIIPDDTAFTATNAPSALAVDPGTNKLYVADSANRSVNVIDLNMRTFLKQVFVPASTGTDEGPIGVAVDSVAHRVYATMRYWQDRPAVVVIDGA